MLAETAFPRRGAASSRHRRRSLPKALVRGQHELQGSSPPRLYRQFFTREECQMLDATPPESAVHEIYLLRVLTTRVLAAARASKRPASIAHSVSTRKRSQRLSLKQRLSILTAFCGAALTIASLARFEYKAQGPGPILVDLLYPEDDDLDL